MLRDQQKLRRSPRKARQEPIEPVSKITNSDNNGEPPRAATKEKQGHKSPAELSLEANLAYLSNLQRQQEQTANNNNKTPRKPPESRFRLTPPEVILANFRRQQEAKEIAREKEKTIKKQQEMLRAARVENKAILAQLKAAEDEAKARTAALGDSMAQEVAKKERLAKVNCTPVYVSSVVLS